MFSTFLGCLVYAILMSIIRSHDKKQRKCCDVNHENHDQTQLPG